jgi:hypothetical protein
MKLTTDPHLVSGLRRHEATSLLTHIQERKRTKVIQIKEGLNRMQCNIIYLSQQIPCYKQDTPLRNPCYFCLKHLLIQWYQKTYPLLASPFNKDYYSFVVKKPKL